MDSDRRTPGEVLANARSTYADKWTVSAEWHEAEGHYKWMADDLGLTDATILEIGVGDGRSTLELLSRGHTVVSIDENPECLAAAKARLESAGYEATVELRGAVQEDDFQHAVVYRTPNTRVRTGWCHLIEGDPVVDPGLRGWLERACGFDAVVCWLIGTHNARLGSNFHYHAKEVRSSGDYRLVVQNEVYELADLVLNRGGFLHVVDRGEVEDSEEYRNDVLSAHRDQASTTKLVVERCSHIVTGSVAAEGGKEMVMTPGSSGRPFLKSSLGLVAITSRRP
jgi:hypothetical protein